MAIDIYGYGSAAWAAGVRMGVGVKKKTWWFSMCFVAAAAGWMALCKAGWLGLGGDISQLRNASQYFAKIFEKLRSCFLMQATQRIPHASLSVLGRERKTGACSLPYHLKRQDNAETISLSVQKRIKGQARPMIPRC